MEKFINLNKMGYTAFCVTGVVFFAFVYFSCTSVLAENGSTGKGVVIKTDDKKAEDSSVVDNTGIVPSGADFIKVTEKCAKCHVKQFSSMASLKEAKWIVRGKPEISPIYKVIGKNRKKDGTYHNITEAEKATLYNYIKNLK
jgi:hypothetical protein